MKRKRRKCDVTSDPTLFIELDLSLVSHVWNQFLVSHLTMHVGLFVQLYSVCYTLYLYQYMYK